MHIFCELNEKREKGIFERVLKATERCKTCAAMAREYCDFVVPSRWTGRISDVALRCAMLPQIE